MKLTITFKLIKIIHIYGIYIAKYMPIQIKHG